MALIDDYRGQADECRRLAETASDPGDQSVWRLLEDAWRQLSADAPRLLQSGAPPPMEKRKGKRKR